MSEYMPELESLKEDLYKLVGELRERDIQCKEDEYFQLGKDDASDRLTELLRGYEHNAS